jgi:hypothetical protein
MSEDPISHCLRRIILVNMCIHKQITCQLYSHWQQWLILVHWIHSGKRGCWMRHLMHKSASCCYRTMRLIVNLLRLYRVCMLNGKCIPWFQNIWRLLLYVLWKPLRCSILPIKSLHLISFYRFKQTCLKNGHCPITIYALIEFPWHSIDFITSLWSIC